MNQAGLFSPTWLGFFHGLLVNEGEAQKVSNRHGYHQHQKFSHTSKQAPLSALKNGAKNTKHTPSIPIHFKTRSQDRGTKAHQTTPYQTSISS
jgi:hypothetical protein